LVTTRPASATNNRLAADTHPSTARVELQVAHTQDPLAITRVSVPAQQGAQARHQHPGIAGLGHIVVGAQLQADHRIGVLAARGQHQHRRLELGTRCAQQFQSAQPGQHHIEDHRVPPLPDAHQCRRTVVDCRHLETVACQVLDQQFAQGLVIIDQQDSWLRSAHGAIVNRSPGRSKHGQALFALLCIFSHRQHPPLRRVCVDFPAS
jgi:hypothetical protein